jgi:hypothetical protein
MKFRSPALILASYAALGGFCAETNSSAASAQDAAANVTSYGPAVLPGNGPAQHPFVYTGEYDDAGSSRANIVCSGYSIVKGRTLVRFDYRSNRLLKKSPVFVKQGG